MICTFHLFTSRKQSLSFRRMQLPFCDKISICQHFTKLVFCIQFLRLCLQMPMLCRSDLPNHLCSLMKYEQNTKFRLLKAFYIWDTYRMSKVFCKACDGWKFNVHVYKQTTKINYVGYRHELCIVCICDMSDTFISRPLIEKS